jgi:hypothetical protein
VISILNILEEFLIISLVAEYRSCTSVTHSKNVAISGNPFYTGKDKEIAINSHESFLFHEISRRGPMLFGEKTIL